MVVTYTTSNSWTLSTGCICVFCMTLTLNTHFSPLYKTHYVASVRKELHRLFFKCYIIRNSTYTCEAHVIWFFVWIPEVRKAYGHITHLFFYKQKYHTFPIWVGRGGWFSFLPSNHGDICVKYDFPFFQVTMEIFVSNMKTCGGSRCQIAGEYIRTYEEKWKNDGQVCNKMLHHYLYSRVKTVMTEPRKIGRYMYTRVNKNPSA